MTLLDFKSKLEIGDRVWVEGEDCFGVVQEFDRTQPLQGIDVLLESDNEIVSAAFQQCQLENQQ